MARKPALPDEPYLTRIVLKRDEIKSFDRYPFSLPVVRNLDRLEFHPKVTYLVGENGTGKSTLLEAIAIGAGFNPEGGSKNFNFATHDSHSSLHEFLKIGRGLVREHDGFFLRAESFYNVASEIERLDSRKPPPPTRREELLTNALNKAVKELARLKRDTFDLEDDLLPSLDLVLNPPNTWMPAGIKHFYGGSLHEKSHGESFLALAEHRFRSDSLYILDEPEAALSPARQLAILLRIHDLVQTGSCQFIIATHSPILMAYPNARMYELGENGIAETHWKETEHYQLTRSFLNNPGSFLHHLLGDSQ